MQSWSIVLKVNVPASGMQKMLRALPSDTIWNFKTSFMERAGMKDAYNHGLLVLDGKGFRYLAESVTFADEGITADTTIDFVPKARLEIDEKKKTYKIHTPTKKKYAKLVEEFQRCLGKPPTERFVKELMAVDPNFNLENDETLLSMCVANEDLDMMDLLVVHGAHLDFRLGPKFNDKTVLHIAAENNKIKSLRKLLDRNFWIDAPDGSRLTALTYAVSNGHTELCLRLLIRGASVHVYDESGRGPLHSACMENREAILALLIDFGADITAINIAGNTPLHTAAVRNSKNCIDALLIRGADRTTINRTGQTAEKIANLGGFNDIVKTIQEFNDECIIPPPPRMPILSTQDQQLILNNVLGSLRGPTEKYTIKPLPISNHRRELIEKKTLQQNRAVDRHSSVFSLQSIDTPKGTGRETPTKIEEGRSVSPEPAVSELCVVPEYVPEDAVAIQAVEMASSPEPVHEEIIKVEDVKKPVSEKETAHAALEQFRSVIDSMCIGSVDVERVLETFHIFEKAVQPFVND